VHLDSAIFTLYLNCVPVIGRFFDSVQHVEDISMNVLLVICDKGVCFFDNEKLYSDVCKCSGFTIVK